MPRYTPADVLEKCRQYPIVPVFYHADTDYVQQIIKACYAGGLRVFEYTNRGTGALAVFAQLVPFVREHCPDMAIGAGTILTPDEATRFLDAGANFIVQPVTTPAVAEVCHQRGIAWVPAAATLNEIYNATLLGAELVKVFPGNVVGPGFIKAIRGPMPQLTLMVTGGVEPTPESLQQWFGAGVCCVGIGSQLFAGDNLSAQALEARITQLMSIVNSYKS